MESLLGGYPDRNFGQRHKRKIDVLDEIMERDEVATALGVMHGAWYGYWG